MTGVISIVTGKAHKTPSSQQRKAPEENSGASCDQAGGLHDGSTARGWLTAF